MCHEDDFILIKLKDSVYSVLSDIVWNLKCLMGKISSSHDTIIFVPYRKCVLCLQIDGKEEE